MRFLMNQSVVELRAKGLNDDWYSKNETMYAMNWLGCIFEKAAMQYDAEGKQLLAHIARQDATAIFNKLEDHHFYDN